MHTLLINIIGILSIVGFTISTYIYNKKITKKKLVCPRRSNCDTVIHSDYSKILGIKVEVLGMIYYFLVGSVYTYVFIFSLWSENVALVMLGISMCSVLFSIYLVSMQAFIIKQWCIWCLSSALISIVIFIASYIHMVNY